MLSLRGVTKLYPNGVAALAGIDLDVAEGDFLALLGASGCGKTSLLRLIAGLSAPSAGEIRWSSPPQPGAVGFVFQEPTLMPWSDLFDNVALPLRLAGVSRSDAASRVNAALQSVGLDAFAAARPAELSGGMKMRASIARALVTEPRLLLLDEPFAALDEITRFRLNDDLRRLWSATGCTILFVTHSVFESAYLATRVAVLTSRPGRIVRQRTIDLPAMRDAQLRTEPSYAAVARQLSDDLAAAMHA